MTKGKLVFFVVVLTFILFDCYYIYNYGDPMVEHPTFAQVVVVISGFLTVVAGVIAIATFIVCNWEEPFKSFKNDARK